MYLWQGHDVSISKHTIKLCLCFQEFKLLEWKGREEEEECNQYFPLVTQEEVIFFKLDSSPDLSQFSETFFYFLTFCRVLLTSGLIFVCSRLISGLWMVLIFGHLALSFLLVGPIFRLMLH